MSERINELDIFGGDFPISITNTVQSFTAILSEEAKELTFNRFAS